MYISQHGPGVFYTFVLYESITRLLRGTNCQEFQSNFDRGLSLDIEVLLLVSANLKLANFFFGGVFQLLEMREKESSKNHQISILGFLVSSQNIEI
jgi:hypothetical protein